MHKSPIAGLLTAFCLFASGLPLSNAAKASEVTLPFYSVGYGKANPVPLDACTTGNHETATGYALPIGAFTQTDDEIGRSMSCSSPGSAIVVSGKFKLVAANGDEINGEYLATGTVDLVNGVSVQGGYKFLSGTGRFSQVKGGGVLVSHSSATPPYDFIGTFTGVISYQGEKRPNGQH